MGDYGLWLLCKVTSLMQTVNMADGFPLFGVVKEERCVAAAHREVSIDRETWSLILNQKSPRIDFSSSLSRTPSAIASLQNTPQLTPNGTPRTRSRRKTRKLLFQGPEVK